MINDARSWAKLVRKGDLIEPIPLWNRSSRPHARLNVPTVVLEVRTDLPSQTGISFIVRQTGGAVVALDAAWFKEPLRKE